MNFLNKKYLQTFLAIGPFIAFFITIIGYFAFAFGTVIYAVSEPESDPSTFLTGGMVLFFILLILNDLFDFHT